MNNILLSTYIIYLKLLNKNIILKTELYILKKHIYRYIYFYY